MGIAFRRLGVDGTWYDDEIDLEPNKFLRQFADPFGLSLRPPVLDGDVSTLHVAQVAKPLTEGLGLTCCQTVREKTDAVDLPRLLRAGGERHGQHQKGNHGGTPSDCRSHDHFPTDRASGPPNAHAQRPEDEQRERRSVVA